jgi:tripartite-type tricarboxylate transporter receptor subunit TctC
MKALSKSVALLVVGLASAVAPVASGAQTTNLWPTQTIRIVVGFAPGSSPDVQARMLAAPLSAALGQPVVVENKPGASGNIAADAVAKATDGHTIGLIGNGPLTSSQFLFSRLPYDPAKDFAPLALVGAAPLVWVTAKGSPGSTPEQFVAQARAQGDKIAYGSVGAGSATHLAVELLKPALKINPIHVPFNGGPPVLNALVAGQVQMALLPGSTVMPLVQAGKIDAIAISSAKRSALAPTLPAMEDLGVKGVNIEVWNAVMAPSSMPSAHQARLSTELQRLLASREIRQNLLVQGWRANDSSPMALAKRIEADRAIYKDVIAKNGIQIN